MEKVFFGACMLVILYQPLRAQGYEISFDWKGLEGQSVLVGYHMLGKKYSLDSLHFDKRGHALLQGRDSLQAGVYFLYKPDYYFEFVIGEAQQFNLKGSTRSGYPELKIEGSRDNEVFRAFQVNMSGLQTAIRRYQEQLHGASSADSTHLIASIQDANLEMERFRDSLIAAHPSGLVTDMLRVMRGVQVPDFEEIEDVTQRRRKQSAYFRSHYFEMISQPWALNRTPVWKDYVEKYFNNVVLVVPDSMVRAIDDWLEWCRPDQVTYRFWLQYFLEDYQDTEIMGMDKVWIHLIEHYCLTGEADWLTEKTLKVLKDEVKFIKPNLIGEPAPRFHAVDTLLQPFSVFDLEADYLILFFYDPECGHCKQKTPLLNQNHEEIRSLGGEIVGICTTTEVDKWKKFIHDYRLNWVHVADPYGRSNFRVHYNTRTTPQLYVLDKKRKIIAKRLAPEHQLVEFLRNYQKVDR